MGIEGSGLVGGGKTGAADEEAQGLLEEYQGELAKELPGLSGTTQVHYPPLRPRREIFHRTLCPRSSSVTRAL